MSTVRASAYLIVEATSLRAGKVVSTRIAGVRVSRPALSDHQVAVRVHIDLPQDIFERITPEAVVVVPEDLIIHPVVEVTAGQPEDVVDA